MAPQAQAAAAFTLLPAFLALLALSGSPQRAAAQGLDGLTNTIPGLTGTGLWKCPPEGFDSVKDFDLRAYAAAPWFVQRQLPLSYQPRNELYCVRASYKLRDAADTSEGVLVQNTANRDNVTGPSVGNTGGSSPFSKLVAVPDPDADGPTGASKLRVGPELLLNLPTAIWKPLLGPYWVVATGPSANKTLAYDWAIVAGGPPRISTLLGCRPGLRPGSTDNAYFGGLWFFTRKPNPGPATIAVMAAKAVSMGLDITQMVEVPHKGCTYPPIQ